MEKFHKHISKKDPKARVAHMSEKRYEAYCEFRALLWDAIDNKKEISIVETAKRLGLS